jgi:hypothetical protein
VHLLPVALLEIVELPGLGKSTPQTCKEATPLG